MMGTNYYAVRNRPSVEEPIHIGKCSAGWKFNFERHNDTCREPPVVWNTYNQVKNWLYENTVRSEEYVIMDEYDRIVPYSDLIDMIQAKQEEESEDNFVYSTNVDGYRFSDGPFW